jgi:hypothetical protein
MVQQVADGGGQRVPGDVGKDERVHDRAESPAAQTQQLEPEPERDDARQRGC